MALQRLEHRERIDSAKFPSGRANANDPAGAFRDTVVPQAVAGLVCAEMLDLVEVAEERCSRLLS